MSEPAAEARAVSRSVVVASWLLDEEPFILVREERW